MEEPALTIIDIALRDGREKETVRAIERLLDGLTVEQVERILFHVHQDKKKAIFRSAGISNTSLGKQSLEQEIHDSVRHEFENFCSPTHEPKDKTTHEP